MIAHVRQCTADVAENVGILAVEGNRALGSVAGNHQKPGNAGQRDADVLPQHLRRPGNGVVSVTVGEWQNRQMIEKVTDAMVSIEGEAMRGVT